MGFLIYKQKGSFFFLGEQGLSVYIYIYTYIFIICKWLLGYKAGFEIHDVGLRG